tara:strand:- start:144 stop:347 length:204 start_codon:yes stop_codon:yes gene_type:complete
MGYDIRPISELNTFDYSLCTGFQNADTVRKSIDGQLFIVEGDSFNTYTQAEMLVICEGSNWTEEEIV